jgi:hypothetical protein
VRLSCSIFAQDCDAISKENFEIKWLRKNFAREVGDGDFFKGERT